MNKLTTDAQVMHALTTGRTVKTDVGRIVRIHDGMLKFRSNSNPEEWMRCTIAWELPCTVVKQRLTFPECLKGVGVYRCPDMAKTGGVVLRVYGATDASFVNPSGNECSFHPAWLDATDYERIDDAD